MRINYSCVVDNQERFLTQGWLWMNSLIEFGKINPENIWMHFIKGIDGDYIKKCLGMGINVEVIEPYGDKTYCNKIAQMSNAALKDSDALILMDTDMIMLENFEKTFDYDYINAKIVDLQNPPIKIIDELFILAGLKKTIPDVPSDYEEGLTYGANFNGGLYVIPQKFYDIIQYGWEKWSQYLLKNGKPLYDAKKEAHIDQLSFCMTVHENNIPIKYLNRLHNYPLPFQLGDSERIPYVLHYHTNTDENNLLTIDYQPIGNIKKAIEKANKFILEKSLV